MFCSQHVQNVPLRMFCNTVQAKKHEMSALHQTEGVQLCLTFDRELLY